jgi:hypothetical protein
MREHRQTTATGKGQPLFKTFDLGGWGGFAIRLGARIGVEEAGFQQSEKRLEAIRVSETEDQLDQITEVPARLPTVADASENLPTGRLQFLEPTINEDRIGDGSDDALDQFLDGPLIARLDEAAGDLAKEVLLVASQGALQQVRPERRLGEWH